MKDWQPLDYIVLILVLFIAVSLGAVMFSTTNRTEPLNENSAEILGDLYGSAIAIIGVYVGSKMNSVRKEK